MGNRTVIASWFIAAAAHSFGFAGVHVVDPQGGSGEAQLVAALAAAQEGDVILLRAGDYSRNPPAGYTFVNRGFSIVGDDPLGVELPGLVVTKSSVSNTYPLVLRRLNIQGLHQTGYGSGIWITGHAPYVIEDCVIRGAAGIHPSAGSGSTVPLLGGQGLRFDNANQMAFIRCKVLGGAGASSIVDPISGAVLRASRGGDAVNSWKSPFIAHQTVFIAGDGGSNWLGNAAGQAPSDHSGGYGISIVGSHGSPELHGCSVNGGSNGVLLGVGLGTCGHGATLALESPMLRRDTTFAAGTPIAGGQPGAAIYNPGNLVIITYPAKSRSIEIDACVREGQAGQWTVSGSPGDFAIAFVSTNSIPNIHFTPHYQGVWHLHPYPNPNILTLPLGTLPASGVGTWTMHAPSMPVGVDAQRIFVQLGILSQDGATLEGLSCGILLDASF